MKVGIITLHKVVNFGSALQAYALQHYLKKILDLNSRVEIIDYKFPNSYHFYSFQEQIKNCLRRLYNIFRKRTCRFNFFYRTFFIQTPKSYKSVKSIFRDPPVYDLYVTGSDQVWNVVVLKNDPVMYCCFAPDTAKRIAFGASFSAKSLSPLYYELTRKRLNKYSFIGVREATGLSILENLKLDNGIVKANTCDPTLLLDAKDYFEIASYSKITIKGDYILVYFLNYAYQPEPAMSIAINDAVRNLKCRVIKIGNPGFSYSGAYRSYNDIGPCEFAYLFKNAKYVITSSFHGTMFAVINRKPFVAILPDESASDCRIKDFLLSVNLISQGVYSNDIGHTYSYASPFTSEIELCLDKYINSSKNFLKNAVGIK